MSIIDNYTNHETWSMALWVQNEEGIVSGNTTKERLEALESFRELLKEELDSYADGKTISLISYDFLFHAIDAVNWQEIEAMLIGDKENNEI